MIRSFKCKETEKIWNGQWSRTFTPEIQKRALRKLRMLDSSGRLDDLKISPSNRLEALVGDREGQYSIRVNQQWRICFDWINDNADNVKIVDYH